MNRWTIGRRTDAVDAIMMRAPVLPLVVITQLDEA